MGFLSFDGFGGGGGGGVVSRSMAEVVEGSEVWGVRGSVGWEGSWKGRYV